MAAGQGTNVGSIFYSVELETQQLINGRKQVEAETEKAARAFNAITLAVKVYAAALAALKMAEAADDFRMLQARVNVAADSIEAGAAAFERLRAISVSTRSALDSNVQVFTRLNPSIKQMGGNANDTLRVVELLSKAITVSGASAAEKSSAMIQFGQALGSGKLAGDELRSLLENAPYLMKQLADSLGVPIGQLKSLGEQGKLTADVVTNALVKASDRISKDFAQFPQTVVAQLQLVKDQAMALAAAMDSASGKNAILVGVLKGVGDTVQKLAERFELLSMTSTGIGRDDAIKTWAERTSSALEAVGSLVQTVAITVAGAMAGKFVQGLAASTAALAQNVAAANAARAAEAQRLVTVSAGAAAQAVSADVAHTMAVITMEQAAASLAAARANVTLLESQLAQATANATMLTASPAYFEAKAIERTVTLQLAAAKEAEAVASGVLMKAESGLVTARAAAFEAATAEATATAAAAAAKRADTAASVLATGASRAFGTVVSALGGPIGIAIIAIGALALKFSDVKTAAEEAADITERAAQRIAKARSGSTEAPMRELMSVRDEAKAQIEKLDAEISRAEKWARSGRGPQPSDEQVSGMNADLLTKREAARGALLQAQKAIDDLKRQQMEGDTPSNLKSPVDPEEARKLAAKRAAAQAYLEGLKADTKTGLEKINAEERKALDENTKRQLEDQKNFTIYNEAKKAIAAKYARERALLEETYTKESAALNIALTQDESQRIEAIRAEAFRAAEAEVKLGVKTFQQGEQAKLLAAYTAGQAMLDLADRTAKARFDQSMAETRDMEARIALTREETIRALELAAARGKITQAELDAGRARADRQATDDTKAVKNGRTDTKIDTLQLRAGSGGIEDQVALIQAEGQKRLDASMQAQQADLANTQLYADQRVAIEEDMQRRITDARSQSQINALSSTSSALEALANATKSGTEKQDAVYRAAFLAQKAYAIASSIVAIQAGVAKAADAPWPGNLAGMASVIAATASIISTIKGANYGGGREIGGSVSAGTMVRVNESGRPEMFTAAGGVQYMLPTADGRVTSARELAASGSGQAGQRPISVVQNFTVAGGTDQRSQQQIAASAARGLQIASARNN